MIFWGIAESLHDTEGNLALPVPREGDDEDDGAHNGPTSSDKFAQREDLDQSVGRNLTDDDTNPKKGALSA